MLHARDWNLKEGQICIDTVLVLGSRRMATPKINFRRALGSSGLPTRCQGLGRSGDVCCDGHEGLQDFEFLNGSVYVLVIRHLGWLGLRFLINLL